MENKLVAIAATKSFDGEYGGGLNITTDYTSID